MPRLPILPLLVVLTAAPGAAQDVLWDAHGGTCTLYEDGGVARPGPALDPGLLDQSALRTSTAASTAVTEGAGSTFEVTYTGFTAEAQAAFQAAVDVWADHLVSPVPIRVEASFGPLGENVLGSAGPRLTADFAGAPRRRTWYPFALADALAEKDLHPDYADVVATFNSSFEDWYYGTDGAAPSNKFDFVTVVLHELGHGLGFVGSGDVDDGAGDPECDGVPGHGCWGIATGSGTVYPFVFDGLVEAGTGTAFLDQTSYPQNSAALGGLLQSEDLFVDAPTVLAVNGDVRGPVWAPAPFDAGSSFSHWDEVLVTAGTSAALMTPQIGRGEAYQDPGTITCAFFQDMGWGLGAGCAALVTADAPPAFSSSPVTAAVEGEPYAYTASASDPDGAAVTFSATSLPSWLALVDQGDGTATLSGTPDDAEVGEHSVVLVVSDGGLSAEQAFTVAVADVNNAPAASETLTPEAGETLDLSGDPETDVVATWEAAADADGDPVSYRWEVALTDGFDPVVVSAETDGTSTATTYGALSDALRASGVGDGQTATVYHRVVTSDGLASTAGPAAAFTAVQGASTSAAALPPAFALLDARPNPTAGRFTIAVDLAETSRVRLDVYDLLGRRVTGMDAGTVPAGGGRLIEADLSDLGPGVYAYRLTATGAGVEVAAGRATVIR